MPAVVARMEHKTSLENKLRNNSGNKGDDGVVMEMVEAIIDNNNENNSQQGLSQVADLKIEEENSSKKRGEKI